MFTPGPRTLPKILFIVLMVLLVACTSLPVPTPAVKPASTPTDTPETIWPTCIPMLQKGYPFSAIWSPTESIVALVNGSGICLYDAVALRDLRFIEIASPTQVVFSPDGQLLASVDSNTTAIRLWDVATGRRVRTLSRADDQRFYELVFAPDSKTLASISYAVVPADQSIQLWDVATGQERRAISGMYVQKLVFSPDSQWLVLMGRESKLWKIATDQVLPLPFPADELPIYAPVFSPDSTTLAWVGASDRTAIQLWDLPTGRIRQTLRGHTAEVERLVFSPDGQILASSASWPHDITMKLWNVQTGQELYSLAGHASFIILDMMFSPDGRTLASSDCCTPVRLWNVQTGQEWFPDKRWDVNDILRFSAEGKPPLAPGKVLNFGPSTQETVSFSADGQRRISRSWGAGTLHSVPQFFDLSNVTTGSRLSLVNGVFHTLSLDTVANADTPFLFHTSGQALLDTSWPDVPGTRQLLAPFDLAPRVFKSQTAGSLADAYPTAAQLSMDISNAYRVYLLLNTEKSPGEFKGKTIGQVAATCDGAHLVIAELRLGVNVGDVDLHRVYAMPTPGAENIHYSGDPHYRLSTLSLNLPPACWSGHLTQLEVSDTSRDTVGSLDPGLVLAGVTVESRTPAQ